MKSTTIRSLAVLVASSAPLAAGLKTIANPAPKENYANGEVMDNIMSAKYVSKLTQPPSRDLIILQMDLITSHSQLK